MGKKKKKLTAAQRRRRFAHGGKSSRGPRVEAGDGATSARGYRIPTRYKGTRHAERNALIHRLVFEEGKTHREVAKMLGMNEHTVGYIARYWQPPDAEGE